MKKITTMFIFVLALATFLCACDTQKTAGGGSPLSDLESKAESSMTDSSADADIQIGVVADSEDGTILSVDTTVRGEIKSGAPAIDASHIVLDGDIIDIPFTASVLFNHGWSFSQSAREMTIRAKTSMSIGDGYLYNDNGDEIKLNKVVNEADSEQQIGACKVTAFEIATYNLNENFGDCLLPGGVCLFSSAADVLSVYGMPDGNPYFEEVRVYEDGIRYENHKATGISFYFNFYDEEDYDGQLNGCIKSLSVEY